MDRITHLDIAKGISIILVALFHSHIKVFIPQLVESMSLFRVPLFFFLSGIFFSTSIRSDGFIKRKMENLLKPYFSVLLLVFLVDAFFLDKGQLLVRFLGIFYGTGETIRWIPMWFLPHLFALHCFAYFLFRYCHFERYPLPTQYFCLILFFIAGLFLMQYLWYFEFSIMNGITIKLPGLPFSIDIILVTATFFLAGHLLKNQVANFTQNTPLLLLCLALFVGITLWTNSYTNLNMRSYINPFFGSVGAICGVYIVLCLSRLLEKQAQLKSLFIALGRGSLFILIFHGIVDNKVYNIVSSLFNDNHSFALACFVFAISIALPLLIKWMVEKSSFLALFFLPIRDNKLFKRRLVN